MSEFQYASEQVSVSGGSVVILQIQPLEQTSLLMNNINDEPGYVPAGCYYYHESEPSYFSVTFIDKGGDEFCRIFDFTISSSSTRVDFGPNIYFDLGQRDSTEE